MILRCCTQISLYNINYLCFNRVAFTFQLNTRESQRMRTNWSVWFNLRRCFLSLFFLSKEHFKTVDCKKERKKERNLTCTLSMKALTLFDQCLPLLCVALQHSQVEKWSFESKKKCDSWRLSPFTNTTFSGQQIPYRSQGCSPLVCSMGVNQN